MEKEIFSEQDFLEMAETVNLEMKKSREAIF